MLIGNHICPIDFLMMAENNPCSLVCNEAFTKLPIIGHLYLTTYQALLVKKDGTGNNTVIE